MTQQELSPPGNPIQPTSQWAPKELGFFERVTDAILRFHRSSLIGSLSAIYWVFLLLVAIFAPYIAPL